MVVLCDTYKPNGQPTDDNFRPQAKEVFDKYTAEESWFGIEQEFFLMKPDSENVTHESVTPLGLS